MDSLFTKRTAFKCILLIGIISFFTDMTYEGARGITGAYLATLGASATLVGIVAGLGEFFGYGLRFLSGYLADRTKRYWLILSLGYSINLISIPLLAFTQHWWSASLLIVLERFGKAIRTPTRDALLSYANEKVGQGLGFGLHQALDKLGGLLGPLLIAICLAFEKNYQSAFAVLGIPAFFALVTLFIVYKIFPKLSLTSQQSFDKNMAHKNNFKLFLIASGLLAAGFTDFPLIAFHFQKLQLLSKTLIPVSYGIALGINTLVAPLCGRLFDRYGLRVFIAVIALAAFFAPLVFLGGENLVMIGVILWGLGFGVQDSLLRSILATMVAENKRAYMYGLFNMVYGIAWFLGSAIQGSLYDFSITLMIIFIVLLQFLALGLFYLLNNKKYFQG